MSTPAGLDAVATTGLELDICGIRTRLEREGWVAREGGDLAPGTAGNIASDAGWL